uniref:Uncharacterized protein n=1 Tax=Ditylenchus dipsaci TaxID=166011 RepID=A0A915ESA8_9BILA
MRFKDFFILLLLYVPTLIAQNEGVKELLDTLTTAAAPDLDALVELNYLQPKTATYVKAIVPAGSFFAKALLRQIPFPKESQDYRDMKTLHVGMNKTLTEILENVINWRKIFDYNSLKLTYALRVDESLETFNWKVNELADPDLPKTDDQILNSFLYQVIVQQCNEDDLTQQRAEHYAKVIEIFTAIQLRIEHSAGDDYGAELMKKKSIEVQSYVGSIALDAAENFLFKLANATDGNFRTFQAAIQTINIVLKNIETQEPSCFTSSTVEASHYMQEPTFKFVDMIRVHTTELACFAVLCANITYTNKPLDVERYYRRTQHLFSSIINKLKVYVPLKLEQYWPKVAKSVENNVLSKHELYPWSLEKWQRAAEDVRTELDARGDPAWEHQVHLAPPFSGDDVYWAWQCVAARCYFEYSSVGNVNMLVTRHKKTNRPLVAPSAATKFKAANETIYKVLSDNYNIDKLPNLFNLIKAAIAKDFFHSYQIVVIVRKYTGWHDGPAKFPFAAVGPMERTYYGAVPCLQQCSYWNNATGTFRDPEHFEISLFI